MSLLERFKAALLQESQQRMAQDPTHEELIQNMMDGMPHGDVFSSREALHDATLRVLSSLQTEEVTRVARDLCSHLSRISETCKPCAVVLCSPHAVSEDEVVEAVVDGLQRSLPPIADLEVPTNLLPDEVLAAKAAEYSATVVSSTDPAPLSSEMASQYRVLHLSNGLRVSLCSHSGEAEKAALRLRARGGRMVERQAGSMALGGKVVQEGGAFRNTSREQVELFCVDHHVAVEVAVKPDAVLVDMDTTTASGPGGLSGVEAALQVAHILLTDARYEDNAFHRALVAAEEAHSAANRALDSACQQALLHSMTGGDARHLEPSPEALRRIPLPLVEAEMREAFRPENVEVS